MVGAMAEGIRINGEPASAADVVAIGQSLDDEDGGFLNDRPAWPDALAGHWDTAAGRQMAESNMRVESRGFLTKGEVSDFALANAVFLAGRDDLDLIVWQTAAKERIRWLSAQLATALTAGPSQASATAKLEQLRTAVRKVLPSGAARDDLPDTKVLATYVTMAELRNLHALSAPTRATTPPA